MKKLVSTVLALILAAGSVVFAQPCPNDGGCGNCDQGRQLIQAAPATGAAGETDAYRQFMLTTLDLRQEMMIRRFEIQRENLKGTPDTRKIAALKADVAAIQARISDIRAKSGLPEDGKRDGECYKRDAGCDRQYGLGGCNGGPCWQK